ncbi:MAG: peptidylprolyl isomerase, partial [Verrucomicrobia bacterium]|nr:peptidylprolyl isomerase [Verrucomicrobiota bacterium]
MYLFRVKSYNALGKSVASNVATVGTSALGVPLNLSATAVDPFNVSLKWADNSTGESGFAIEMKTGSGTWVYLDSVGVNIVSISPRNLIFPLETFSFRVRAYKGTTPPTTPDSPPGADVSAYSDISIVNSGSYILTATADPCQQLVNLSWPNILNEAGYDISYKVEGDSAYTLLTKVAADVTNYKVEIPQTDSAMVVSFIVAPYKGTVTMAESSVATVTVDAPLVMTSKSGTSGTPGSPFAHTFTHAGGAAVSSRTLSGDETGLTFNSSTGELTGVYPALGNYTVTYTVHDDNGCALAQTFYIRVRPPAGPPVVGTIIPSWSGTAGGTRDTALAGTFTDPEAESAVRVSTTLGNMDFILFDTATPATVVNFMSYVNAGKYTDVAFHRSVPDFVIQGGGFKGAGTGSNFTSVVTNPPVTNEPGIANVRGTVSMAKLGGDPNSATSQFFVSLGDNRANLDYQNG